MGNGHNHHPQLHHKTTFLPMLCLKPSIKDVAIPRREDKSMSSFNDPLSPEIGCMGQVKGNNKIVGFPTLNNKLTITTTKNSNPVKYSKLKKFFSGKNLTSTSTASSMSSTTATATCYRKRDMILGGGSGAKIYGDRKEDSVSISIDEMDPPLPVIKKVQKASGDGGGQVDNLWKRRSGGGALKNLQLQHLQLNRHHLAPTTV